MSKLFWVYSYCKLSWGKHAPLQVAEKTPTQPYPTPTRNAATAPTSRTGFTLDASLVIFLYNLVIVRHHWVCTVTHRTMYEP